jgi:hypothetical protein
MTNGNCSNNFIQNTSSTFIPRLHTDGLNSYETGLERRLPASSRLACLAIYHGHWRVTSYDFTNKIRLEYSEEGAYTGLGGPDYPSIPLRSILL